MEILITSKTENAGTTYVEVACGAKAAHVSINRERREVWVCAKNASHKVWRGFGRRFETVAQALAAYKSGEMQAMIRAAADLCQEVEAVS